MTEKEANDAQFEAWVRTHEAVHGAIEIGDCRAAWQASRQQALEEAAQRIESHKTGASLDLVVQGFANEVRSLTTTGDKA